MRSHLLNKRNAGKILCASLIASFAGSNLWAQSRDYSQQIKDVAKEMVSFEAELDTRITSLEDGESVLVYDPTIGANVKLMKEGCLTVKTAVSSYDKDSNNNFNDPTMNSGVLDGSHSDIGFGVSSLYVESDCLFQKALKLQAGAMRTESSGSMGIDNDGFMDAMKAVYNTNLKAIANVSATYGRLDTQEDVNVFDREYSDIEDNFKQITVSGGHGAINYSGELTRLNDRDYIRLSASIAINTIFKHLDNVRVEVLREEDDIVGSEYSLRTAKFANGMQLEVGYRDLEDGTSLPIDEKVLQDKAYFAKLVKQVTKSCQVGLSIQDGDNLGARIDAEGNCRW
tara:strand:+ start:23565 stop:24587 length:1023 start_codon:yes stop_codon:yes gene_type:complete